MDNSVYFLVRSRCQVHGGIDHCRLFVDWLRGRWRWPLPGSRVPRNGRSIFRQTPYIRETLYGEPPRSKPRRGRHHALRSGVRTSSSHAPVTASTSVARRNPTHSAPYLPAAIRKPILLACRPSDICFPAGISARRTRGHLDHSGQRSSSVSAGRGNFRYSLLLRGLLYACCFGHCSIGCMDSGDLCSLCLYCVQVIEDTPLTLNPKKSTTLYY